eukprot:scaffold262217_cov15-Tisochrysis_lutea.AAC.1
MPAHLVIVACNVREEARDARVAPVPAHGRQQVTQHIAARDGAVDVADDELGAPAIEVDVGHEL